MRGLVQRVRRTDPDAAESLAVIGTFDELNAQQASLDALVSAGANISACTVIAWDLLNARTLSAMSDGVISVPQDAPPIDRELPSYGALEIDGDLYVSIHTASGSIGLIRFAAIEQQWRDLDYMVAERLAASVAIEATKFQQQLLTERRIEPTALVQLISSGLDDAQLQLALSRAQLPTDRNLTAIAVRSRTDAIGPHVAARIVAEAFLSVEIPARATTIENLGLVIAGETPDVQVIIDDYCDAASLPATSLSIGVGTPGPARLLPQSWIQAAQAFALVTPHGDGNSVSAFNDLGALALISRLPAEEVNALPDILHLRRIYADDPYDVQLLELYCETASMRTVAQHAHMHHSSVDYRLKRIGKALGINLGSPTGRLRALLAVKLLRVEQARPGLE
jgi:sugar diacid utilization regulator